VAQRAIRLLDTQMGKPIRSQLAAAGANSSAAHWGFMVDSHELEIDGETAERTRTPIIRFGTWMLR
jgi:leucyl aminopeptidase (aminopeptidase T)